mgnify:CR=1 FL=1
MYKKEFGRTMVEIVAVLVVMGLLSLTGLWWYSVVMRHQKTDELLNALQMKTVEINSAMQGKNFATDEELNQFLSGFTAFVAGHTLSFYASPDKDGFVARISHLNGDKIKGALCRELITKMADQKFVSDVDFTLEGEELDDGTVGNLTVRLNGRVVNLIAMCGG